MPAQENLVLNNSNAETNHFVVDQQYDCDGGCNDFPSFATNPTVFSE
jgi:hypothetical protein